MAASGSASALAVKAAAVAAVLAVLVMPSLGRCPSLGPEKPSPPAAAPAPAPAMSCSECTSRCPPMCKEYVAATCSSYCTPPPYCDGCRDGSVQGQQCAQCFNSQCADCTRLSSIKCTDNCYSQCYATGVCT